MSAWVPHNGALCCQAEYKASPCDFRNMQLHAACTPYNTTLTVTIRGSASSSTVAVHGHDVRMAKHIPMYVTFLHSCNPGCNSVTSNWLTQYYSNYRHNSHRRWHGSNCPTSLRLFLQHRSNRKSKGFQPAHTAQSVKC